MTTNFDGIITFLNIDIESLVVSLFKGLAHIFVETDTKHCGGIFKVLHIFHFEMTPFYFINGQKNLYILVSLIKISGKDFMQMHLNSSKKSYEKNMSPLS